MTFRMRDAEYAQLARLAHEVNMPLSEMIRTTLSLAASVYRKGARVRSVADQLAEVVADALKDTALGGKQHS